MSCSKQVDPEIPSEFLNSSRLRSSIFALKEQWSCHCEPRQSMK